MKNPSHGPSGAFIMRLLFLQIAVCAQLHLTWAVGYANWYQPVEYYVPKTEVGSARELLGRFGNDLDEPRRQRFLQATNEADLKLDENQQLEDQSSATYLNSYNLLQELYENLRDLSDENLAVQLNKHLPDNDPFGDDTEATTFGPVNEPAAFEASLGQFTDALNHWMPNTANRSHLLSAILSNSILDRPESKMAQYEKLARGEYIDFPLALSGHQYVQGGAGEGRQLLGPDGTFENVQVIKSDQAVPSYCNPPNPCPIGYSAKDGCLEEFVNLASFSREYQVKQKCSCDNEHSLFNCISPLASIKNEISLHQATEDQENPEKQQQLTSDSGDSDLGSKNSNQLDTLARAVQNRFGSLDSIRNLIRDRENMRANEDNDGQQNLFT